MAAYFRLPEMWDGRSSASHHENQHGGMPMARIAWVEDADAQGALAPLLGKLEQAEARVARVTYRRGPTGHQAALLG